MKLKPLIPLPLLALALVAACPPPAARAVDALYRNFAAPPAPARPWVMWFWQNGNITREGITADLEAMHRVGIGGVLILEVAHGAPPGPVDYLGPRWLELVRFAFQEAARLGIAIDMNNDAGWAGSGGPWISPELAMKKVTMSETSVPGGEPFRGTLPVPQTVKGKYAGFYRDVAVLAFPTPKADTVRMAAFAPKVTTNAAGDHADPRAVCDGNPKTSLVLARPSPDAPQWIMLEFAQPFTARTLSFQITSGPPRFMHDGFIEVSDDGAAFKKVCDFSCSPPDVLVNFPETTARCYRVVLNKSRHPRITKVTIPELSLSPSLRLENLSAKAGFIAAQFTAARNIVMDAAWPPTPPALAIDPAAIIDLTEKLDPSGRLDWHPPAGAWTVLRVGCTLTGRENHPAPAGGTGLEPDKLSKTATQAAFAGLMGKIAALNPDLTGPDRPFQSIHVDSWEAGPQNWTDDFPAQFRRLRGYELTRWLPVLSGRVVGGIETSERFLFDFRQTISELLRENYAAELRRLANARGLRLSIEAYFGPPADETAYGGEADEPMAEFWRPKGVHYSAVEMPSAAHLYGRPIVGAEAFTAGDKERWLDHPGTMKEQGDWAFCQGINRFAFHRYAMQPWTGRCPGMTMGPWGVHYERTQTWWEYSKPWHTYLARCQHLLRQGRYVADILVLQAEGTSRFNPPGALWNGEKGKPGANPATDRPGYNYDACPPSALLARVTPAGGLLRLPDGMTYRMLLLPDTTTMTPELLRKIQQIADAGVPVLGFAKPVKTPGLAGHPASDAEVRRLADALWDTGKVITGQYPAGVFASRGIPPDFTARNQSGDNPLRYIHRATPAADFYFVANKTKQPQDTLCEFRQPARAPELWYPETGRRVRPALYDAAGGVVRLPLHLAPEESVFVVFPANAAACPGRVVAVGRDDQPILDLATATVGTAAAGTAATAATTAVAAIAASRIPLAAPEVLCDEQGALEVSAAQGGVYTLRDAAGKVARVTIAPPAEPCRIDGPWTVTFDPKWGGPEKPLTLTALSDWAAHPDTRVRDYSGPAVYRASFTLPDTGAGRFARPRALLDLGRVAVAAEVFLNGQNLGVLWRAPYCADATGALRPGENHLELRVVNLWVNRLIADEDLPPDTERKPTGELAAWPRWLLDGRPSPSGRLTFSTWNLWNKGEPRIESGLLGPVTLQISEGGRRP
jgi:hypothetical protein